MLNLFIVLRKWNGDLIMKQPTNFKGLKRRGTPIVGSNSNPRANFLFLALLSLVVTILCWSMFFLMFVVGANLIFPLLTRALIFWGVVMMFTTISLIIVNYFLGDLNGRIEASSNRDV